jgi:hypothetical protein
LGTVLGIVSFIGIFLLKVLSKNEILELEETKIIMEVEMTDQDETNYPSNQNETPDPSETLNQNEEEVKLLETTSEIIELESVVKERDFSYFQMMKSPEFWIILGIYGGISGKGHGKTSHTFLGGNFVIVNNLGGLIIALGGNDGEQDKYVTILSILSCLGRILTGIPLCYSKLLSSSNYFPSYFELFEF